MKVPDDLMPTQTEHGIKLVPVEAAYSDDEQEAALAHQHKQVSSAASLWPCMLAPSSVASPGLYWKGLLFATAR